MGPLLCHESASAGVDCCDTDIDAFPGQTQFFASPTACGGFDYNCDDFTTLSDGVVYGDMRKTGSNYVGGWKRYLGAPLGTAPGNSCVGDNNYVWNGGGTCGAFSCGSAATASDCGSTHTGPLVGGPGDGKVGWTCVGDSNNGTAAKGCWAVHPEMADPSTGKLRAYSHYMSEADGPWSGGHECSSAVLNDKITSYNKTLLCR